MRSRSATTTHPEGGVTDMMAAHAWRTNAHMLAEFGTRARVGVLDGPAVAGASRPAENTEVELLDTPRIRGGVMSAHVECPSCGAEVDEDDIRSSPVDRDGAPYREDVCRECADGGTP